MPKQTESQGKPWEHQYPNIKRLAFEKFFNSLLMHLAVHDLKLKCQPKTDEPEIVFLMWK